MRKAPRRLLLDSFLVSISGLMLAAPAMAETTITAPGDLEVRGHGPEPDALMNHYALENSTPFQLQILRGFCSGSNTCLGGADDGDFCATNADCDVGTADLPVRRDRVVRCGRQHDRRSRRVHRRRLRCRRVARQRRHLQRRHRPWPAPARVATTRTAAGRGRSGVQHTAVRRLRAGSRQLSCCAIRRRSSSTTWCRRRPRSASASTSSTAVAAATS